MSVYIILDPGHGGKDSGAVGLGLQEKDWALDIVKRINRHFGNYPDVKISATRWDDHFVEIMDRVKFANDRKADLFLSFHNNCGGGSGFESFVSTNASQTSKRIQAKVTNDILNFLKSYGIGAHGDALKVDSQAHVGRIGVLHYTHMPAVLFENLFIDNKKDNALLKSEDFKEKLAEAYVKSIADFYGLKPKKQCDCVDDCQCK